MGQCQERFNQVNSYKSRNNEEDIQELRIFKSTHQISLVKQSMNCSVTLACDVVALTRKDEYILSGPISFSILVNKETITLLNIKTGCVWQSS